MPSTYPPELLRLEPRATPAVRAAFDEALAELSTQLLRLRREALAAMRAYGVYRRTEGENAALWGRA